jgi:2-keto-4-pentenoate hydratase
MTLTAALDGLAEKIRRAYQEGAIPPLRDEPGVDNIDAAYQVQSLNTRFWCDSGRRIVGRKIGLTSEAVQRQLKVNRPDFGVLFADMLVEPDERLPSGRLLQPRIEAEIAFVLSRDIIAERPTSADILSATAYLLPALEVVDSRIAKWDIGIVDTVADNASSGLFVLGRTPVDPRGLDLRTCGMVMEVDGRVSSQGVGAACLGHPVNAVRWLARTLVELGDPLRAGDIVLSGALGPMVPLAGVSRVEASIGGLGTVGVST